MNGDDLKSYLLGGIRSGWTSGLVSGYIAIGPPQESSGVTVIRAKPINSSHDCRNLMILYQPNPNGPELTIWELPMSPLVSQDANEIRRWLFRR